MEVIKLYDKSVQELVTLCGREALQKLLEELKMTYSNDVDSIAIIDEKVVK